MLEDASRTPTWRTGTASRSAALRDAGGRRDLQSLHFRGRGRHLPRRHGVRARHPAGIARGGRAPVPAEGAASRQAVGGDVLPGRVRARGASELGKRMRASSSACCRARSLLVPNRASLPARLRDEAGPARDPGAAARGRARAARVGALAGSQVEREPRGQVTAAARRHRSGAPRGRRPRPRRRRAAGHAVDDRRLLHWEDGGTFELVREGALPLEAVVACLG